MEEEEEKSQNLISPCYRSVTDLTFGHFNFHLENGPFVGKHIGQAR